jgi:hypothetical protein
VAEILAVLMSGRRKGYTANLLGAAIEGMKSVEGVGFVVLIGHLFGSLD